MIHVIQKCQTDEWEDYIEKMHKLRASVFSNRLGWEVNVKGGLEVDEFDSLNPLYLLSIDQSGDLLGSVRLLPTTGPNMLEDVFSVLLGEHGSVRSPLIWEASRFCVATHLTKQLTSNRLSAVTCELLTGMCEIGKIAGLLSFVGVYDIRFRRVLRQAGWVEELIGDPTQVGKVKTFAGLFPVCDKTLENLTETGGFHSSVLSEAAQRFKECQRRTKIAPAFSDLPLL